MELRPVLMPPVLNEKRVARLACFAEQIDWGDPLKTQHQLAAFNKEAMTSFEAWSFHGISGGQDHDTWVRQVLAGPFERRVADVTRAELVEMVRRVMEADRPEHDTAFWLKMLEINIPDERISDLLFWPDDYFGHEGCNQELSPEQMIDVALGRKEMHS